METNLRSRLVAGVLLATSLATSLPAKAQLACTVKTQTQLLATFSDLSGPGTITPRSIRDFVCSTVALIAEPGQSSINFSPQLVAASFVTNSAQVLSQWNSSASGGTTGAVSFNGKFYTTITGAPNQYLWSVLGAVNYQGTGGTGQHVGVYGQGVRSTFSAGGASNNPQIWGAVAEAHDFTGQPTSVTNAMLGMEIDNVGNADDDARIRSGLTVAINKANPAGVDFGSDGGITIVANAGAYVYKLLAAGGNFKEAGIDLRNAGKLSGHTIWLRDVSDISWNNLATATTGWSVANSRLETYGATYFNDTMTINNGIKFVGIGGQVTHSANVGLDTLPANPAGFFTINVQGADVKFPFYNP
jgi:hypothetical protein